MSDDPPCRHASPTTLGVVLTMMLPLAAAVISPAAVRAQEPSADPSRGQAAEPGAATDARGRTVHRISRATSDVQVDGRLDEPAWTDATALAIPWEVSPGDNVPAPVETECLLAYDDEQLYWGCRAYDPDPSSIRAHLADRDTPFEDDHLVLILDTFNDQRRSYQFRVNPRGVQMDALFGQGFEDFSWDAIWSSAGRITDEGYQVEVAIPFESLSFQRTAGPQTWGIMLERSWPRADRHRMRSVPTDRSDPCLLCQAEALTGIQGVQPGTPVELNPTLTAGRTDERPAPDVSRLETGEVDVQPGLNMRWRVTPNVALDGTVNPDFSQVEADAAQLEVNRRFALFFPEKRPFFLEGADLFDVPSRMIFTRSVVDPIAGAKVTGKSGGNALGAFVTHDQVNSLILPGPRASSVTALEEDVSSAVVRYRRDVGEASAVGGFFTARRGDGYHNLLAGADGQIRLSRSNRLVAFAVRSQTEYPVAVAERFEQPAGTFSGEGYALAFSHSGRHWRGAAEWASASPTLRADAGFLPQVGFRGPSGQLAYVFWGDADRWFNQLSFSVEAARREDFDGRLLQEAAEIGGRYEGPLQSTIDYEVEFAREGFGGEEFSLVTHDVFASLRPSGKVEVDVFVDLGDAIDFANVRKASILSVGSGVELRPGAHLELELEHDVERLSREGERIFLANLTQAKAVWHFSRRAFLRGIVQYRHLHRNPAMHDEPVERITRDLFGQFLFSYKVNPRTVLFAGYSDNRLGLTDQSLAQTSRSFFLKLGYAWRP